MSSFNNLLKSSIVYLIGSVFSKAIVFMLVPLYTRYLSTEQYGLYDLETAYLALILSVVFIEIWSAVLRYIYEYKETHGKYVVIKSGNVVFGISTFVFLLIMIVVGTIKDIPYLNWLIIYGITQNISIYYSYIARGLGYNVLFAISGLINTVVVILFNILLIIVLHMGVESLFIASILGYIVNIIMLETRVKILKRCTSVEIDSSLIKKLTKYAIPLCINSLSFWFLTAYSKTVIASSLSLAENGLYAVVGKFSSILIVVSSCFTLAWQEVAFSKDSSMEEKSIFFSKAYDKFMQFISIGFMCILPAIWIVFPAMVGKSYIEARRYIPINILGTLFSILGGFLASIFGNLKETKSIFVTTVVGAVINVISINLLIDKLEISAANISLTLGYLVTIILRVMILKRKIIFKLHIKSMLMMGALIISTIMIYISGSYILNVSILFAGLIIGAKVFRNEIKSVFGRVKKQSV